MSRKKKAPTAPGPNTAHIQRTNWPPGFVPQMQHVVAPSFFVNARDVIDRRAKHACALPGTLKTDRPGWM